MSEQAIETDDEVVIEEPIEGIIEDSEEEAEAKSAVIEDPDDGEVEIFVEGEEQPSSKPSRKSGFQKRFSRIAGQRDDALSEVEAERVRRETVEAERDMWRLKATQTDGPPNEDDFDDPAEFKAASLKYDDERIAKIAGEQAQAIFEKTQGQNTQNQRTSQFNNLAKEHDERAAKLKVDDYDETEEAAVSAMGQDLAEQIIANTDRSEILMYHLGKNPAKAERLYRMSTENPVKCVMEIGRLENSLKTRPKHSPAASPETVIETGVSKTDQVYLRGARFE